MIIKCGHRHQVSTTSDGREVAGCKLVSALAGFVVHVGRDLCMACLDECGANPQPALQNGSDVRSRIARVSIFAMLSAPQNDAVLKKVCGRTRAELIVECRLWGYTEEQMGGALLEGRARADRLANDGLPVESAVTLREIEAAAREARLFG